MSSSRLLFALVACVALAASAGGSAGVARDATSSARPTARVWEVTSTGASAAQARELASALGLEAALWQEDGSLEYVDHDRFLGAPTLPVDEDGLDEHAHRTVTTAFDAEALEALRTLPEGDASKRAHQALKRAGLLPQGARANVGHSRLTLYGAERNVIADADLDTSVSFRQSLGGIPLRGPGAKIRITFAGDGSVSQLRHASRALEAGPKVAIFSAVEARRMCAERYGATGAGAEITAELVYYAPPLSRRTVQTIFPHYACEGTLPSGADLQQIMLPAVQTAPRVELLVETARDGTLVVAHADVDGGRPPYTYGWGSSHGPLDPVARTAGPDISYQPEGLNADIQESVQVNVTDADGLTASSTALSDAVVKLSADTEPTDAPTVGLEWLFGLDEAYGFYGAATSSAAGVIGKFNKGGSEAREKDFKDPSLGGVDTTWVDAVDLAFYKGHANGNGWEFDTQQDDTQLRYTDGKWGNRDLEWLVIEACGPLRPLSDGKDVIERWGPTFAGLHAIYGYATVSWVLEGQGAGFAHKIMGTQGEEATSILDAWAQTAIEIQFGDIEYAAMGPTTPKLVLTGPGQQQPKIVWVSNYDDYFWDRGFTGPDIPAPQGWWTLTAPVD